MKLIFDILRIALTLPVVLLLGLSAIVALTAGLICAGLLAWIGCVWADHVPKVPTPTDEEIRGVTQAPAQQAVIRSVVSKYPLKSSGWN